MEKHEYYISRCILLAKKGIFTALPNPSVGAVIVYNNKVIGEGYTSAYGGAHAEVNAINSVRNKDLLSKSTLYVSLEPCSHFGKTPPCTDLIIERKIPKVVIGTIDPFAKVCGNGIKKLKDNNIEVIIGVLEKECQEVNKRFFTFHEKKRPYIILKWAQTLDNFIAPLHKDSHRPFWISNTISQQTVHQWRTEEMSFLVGTQTVKDDNPSLTARKWFGRNPTRIYIDKQGSIDSNHAITSGEVKTICITANKTLQSTNEVTYIFADFNKNLPLQIAEILYEQKMISVVIEGGATTLQHFIDANLWDEARIFIGNTLLHEGKKAPIFSNFQSIETKTILDNQLQIIKAK